VVAGQAIAVHDSGGDQVSRPPRILDAGRLGKLIEFLLSQGYEVVGPRVRDGAIVCEPVHSLADLPAGWTDEQGPGHYRLKRRDDPSLFGYSVGPQSWKRYLHPPEVRLWSAERQGESFRILNDEPRRHKYAFLGVRACELAAIARQDRVLIEDRYRDSIYEGCRRDLFTIAVQCTQAAATCFCASMGTGPRVNDTCDLILTELWGTNGHRFVVETASNLGAEALSELQVAPATEQDLEEARTAVDAAARQQVRSINRATVKEVLFRNFDHAHWDQVAGRCLTCGNCTMVCPTCFCTTVEDASDITGDHAERWRRWDSCFTLAFSYIHGGSVRTSGKSRYRQWIVHKLASWIDQFGSSGCVGCGRCITWCPVGIDITEEVRGGQGGEHGDP